MKIKPSHVFALGITGLILFYLPTLGHGYFNDDFDHIRYTFKEFLQNPFERHGRPLMTISFLLTNIVSTSSYWHHAVNILLFAILCILCAWIIRRYNFPAVAYLLALAALCHPSMIWPVSWIGQRNDLLLIVFLVLALELYQAKYGVIWIILSAWSKAPYFFQNLVFAYLYLRKKRFISAVLGVLALVVAFYFVWQSYYMGNVADADRGLYLAREEGLRLIAITVAARSIKILEGILITFVPFPAYAVNVPFLLIASVTLFSLWVYLAYKSFKNWPSVSIDRRRRFALYISIALSLSICYGFSSGLRIYVPATLFFFLAAAWVVPDILRTRIALGMITGLLFLGAVINYGPVYTGYHDLSNPIWVKQQPVPANNWYAMRSVIVEDFVRKHFSGPSKHEDSD